MLEVRNLYTLVILFTMALLSHAENRLTSYPDIEQNCLQIQDGYSSEIVNSGKLVYWGVDGFHIFTENDTEPRLWKSVDGGSSATLSESGDWLAYVDGAHEQLIVLSSDRDVVTTHPWDPWDGESQWMRWFDNERLIIYSNRRPYAANLILNPFTGESVELLSSFSDPEYYEYQYDPRLPWGFPIVYDSSFTRAIYLRRSGLAFWDMVQQKVLWSSENIDASLARPVWAHDQSYAIAAITKIPGTSYELYRFDREGQLTQITNLEAVYPNPIIWPPLKWLSDGRHLAFWISSSDKSYDYDAPVRLMVWDMHANIITDYCIGYRAGISSPDSKIVWSPDNQQLAVTISYDSDPSELVVVDIPKVTAVRLGNYPYILGWLK